jgi:ribonuclease Z
MFELIFLGTSAAAPSIRRGLSSAIVMHKEYRFMIDCGEGTQRQLLLSGLGFKRLDRILLTHGHLDHILGLGGLASTFARWEMIPRLEIYSGKWALERVQALMHVVFGPGQPPMDIEFFELSPGLVLEDDTFQLLAFPVQHRGSGSLGYTFLERPKRPFLNEKAEELGVPFGPERKLLVQGEAITLPDGRLIRPDEVLGPATPGSKLVFVGDAGETESLIEPARDADALVIESTYVDEERGMAREFGHLTARQAAELAVSANVRELILTHISRRHSTQQVLDEARAIFPTTTVARDFDCFRIIKDKPIERERYSQRTPRNES